MTLARIASRTAALLLAVALSGLLVASTYGAQAARSGHAMPARSRGVSYRFQAPEPHKYGSNGMRMGLHCDASDTS